MKKVLIVLILGCVFGCSKDEAPDNNLTGTVKYVVTTNQPALYLEFYDKSDIHKRLYVESNTWEYSFDTDSEFVYVQASTGIAGSQTTIFIYYNDIEIQSLGCSDNWPSACLATAKTR